MIMDHMTIALVACSNPITDTQLIEVRQVISILRQHHISVLIKDSIQDSISAKQRADNLMECYRNPEVKMICDISGGDLANGVLSYLDFNYIQKYPKPFCGYSDLTSIINGIYTKTGNISILYQIRNLCGPDSSRQQTYFWNYLSGTSNQFTCPKITMIQGEKMPSSIIAGGNIRCLLKLAGTPFWPDLSDRILLLESLSGGRERIQAFFDQLNHMGVFQQISGLLLGTFTQLDREFGVHAVEQIVLENISNHLIPVGRTMEIGHGKNSLAIAIGKQWEG